MLVENSFIDALCKIRVSGELWQTILAIYMLKVRLGLRETELTARQVSELTGIEPKKQERLLKEAVKLDLVKRYPTKSHPELPK